MSAPGMMQGGAPPVNVTPTMIGCIILAVGFLANAVFVLADTDSDTGLDVVTGLLLLAGYITVRVGSRSLWASQRTMATIGAVVMLGAVILNGVIRNAKPTDLAGIKNVVLMSIGHDALVGIAAVLTLWQLGRVLERSLTIVAVVGFLILAFILYGMIDGLTADNLDNFKLTAKAAGLVETLPAAAAALMCGLLLRNRLAQGQVGPGRR